MTLKEKIIEKINRSTSHFALENGDLGAHFQLRRYSFGVRLFYHETPIVEITGSEGADEIYDICEAQCKKLKEEYKKTKLEEFLKWLK